MKIKIVFISFLIFTFLRLSCSSTEPEGGLKISLEDVSCTEAWLNVSGDIGSELILRRDNIEIEKFTINSSPQSIYDDSLLPNRNYTYQAVGDNEQSNKLTVTTLDTTSQNFSFEYFEFGDGGSTSYFNDVWVFDKNNIWAVGYISPEDTTINGVHIINPNIIRWDGVSWKIQLYSGTTSGMYGIWALNSSNIYFANGAIIKYENGKYVETDLGNLGFTNGQGVEKLWGSSENNIYGVGPRGTVVYFNGQSWAKIEFDTQWHFYEITGNEETGIGYAVATNQSSDCIVVKLENSTTEIIYQQSTSEIKILSVTITELNGFIYIPNDWQNSICRISEKTGKVEVIYQIKGNFGIEQSSAFSSNDIYYFGPNFSGIGVGLLHFNGFRYKMIEIPSIDRDNLGSLHAAKDLAVSVGFTNNKAYLITIKRNP